MADAKGYLGVQAVSVRYLELLDGFTGVRTTVSAVEESSTQAPLCFVCCFSLSMDLTVWFHSYEH